MRPSQLIGLFVLGATLSGSGASLSTHAPMPAPAPAQTGATAPRNPGGANGPVALTPEQRATRRDSLSGLRAAYVAQLRQRIVGREEQPAGEVFENVQLLKDVPAGRFLTIMDSTFGRALSVNCTACHVDKDWGDESRSGKAQARIMIAMTNAINADHLTKMPKRPDGSSPRIGCITCHRGNQQPGNALLP